MTRFKVGDRVRIVGRDHPHSGKAGRIVEPMSAAGLDWVVELDGAYEGRAGCSESDLRKAGEMPR